MPRSVGAVVMWSWEPGYPRRDVAANVQGTIVQSAGDISLSVYIIQDMEVEKKNPYIFFIRHSILFVILEMLNYVAYHCDLFPQALFFTVLTESPYVFYSNYFN